MTDIVSKQKRSEIMRRVKQKDTAPEMIVRRLLHSRGVRYRLHRKDLPGKPDLTFVSKRKIIFVHGCFWHRHRGCKASKLPKSNHKYWLPKLRNNVLRDEKQKRQLQALGWDVLVVWECETKDTDSLALRLFSFLEDQDKY